MVRRMLIDAAHPEEIRVVVIDGNRVDEFDFETSTKKQIKGNIYLAKVTRVEPSLQAGFVDYGGNRHGFLAFNEIHPDYYRIPVADRQALLADQLPRDIAADPFERAAREPETRPAARRDGTSGPPPLEGQTAQSGEPVTPEHPAWPDIPPGAEGASPNPGSTQPTSDPGFQPDTGIFAPLDAPKVEPRPETAAEGPHAQAAEMSWSPGPGDRDTGMDQPAAASPDERPLTTPEGEDAARIPAPAEAATTGEDDRDQEPTVESLGGDDDVDEIERGRRYRFSRHYKIQEVVKRRQVMLVQVVKEERGTKGAALTTYLSLAGRYCVLMPNTARGGGISRRITSPGDRKRLKSIMDDLNVPDGMAVILRTAGVERSKPEIKRDYEYLLRLWDEVRELTLKSTAPCVVYEEANLIKRAIRDLYSRDIDEILVEGEEAYKAARAFMKTLMPSHVGRIQLYRDAAVPLFQRFQVEQALDEIHSPTVRLRSGGYVVINPTEALVAIDVNSGRSTRERHIEETAFKTNLEAADEIARQIRLRDLAGLIVIDFIDMEEHRNQQAVERRLKEAMKSDRARIQIGRISAFGLLELSRQRLRPSLVEVSSQRCPHCGGSGYIRSTESTALHVLRGIEEEGSRQRASEITVHAASDVALYLLNQKRAAITDIEARYAVDVVVERDDTLVPPAYRLARTKARTGPPGPALASPVRPGTAMIDEEPESVPIADEAVAEVEVEPMVKAVEPAIETEAVVEGDDDGRRRRRRRRRRRGRGSEEHGHDQRGPLDEEGARVAQPRMAPTSDSFEQVYLPEDKEIHIVRGPGHEPGGPAEEIIEPAAEERPDGEPRRRRSRRGGRRRGRRNGTGREAQGWTGSTPDVAPPGGASDAGTAPLEPPAAGDEPMARAETAPTHDWPWNRAAEAGAQPVLPGLTETVAVAEPPRETERRAEREAPREATPAPAELASELPTASTPSVPPPPLSVAPPPAPPPATTPTTSEPRDIAMATSAARSSAAESPPPEPAPEAVPQGSAKRGWWRRLTNSA